MTPRIDILDERDSLGGSFVQSVVLHGAVAGLLVLSTISYQHSREVWGSSSTKAGDAVPINAVKTLPLPSRSGPVNKVANDNESRVPQAPKTEPKKQIKAPDEKAIALKSREALKRGMRDVPEEHYRPQPPQPNQVFSRNAPAAVSPMFQKPGSGGVGLGPNSTFGNRFGAYADLVIQRVTQKWQTNGLAGVQAAPMVIVVFEILRDGSVRNVQLAQRSGNSTLDFSALRAVTEAAPFPPLPSEYGGSSTNVELKFQLQR